MARAHSKKLLIPWDQSMIAIVPHDVVQLTSPMLRQAQEGQAARRWEHHSKARLFSFAARPIRRFVRAG
jgi:hypothetical protein